MMFSFLFFSSIEVSWHFLFNFVISSCPLLLQWYNSACKLVPPIAYLDKPTPKVRIRAVDWKMHKFAFCLADFPKLWVKLKTSTKCFISLLVSIPLVCQFTEIELTGK